MDGSTRGPHRPVSLKPGILPVTIGIVQPIIEAKSVSKIYRAGKVEVPALNNVSFMVPAGEFVSIVGPSGSGKSTLFYLLGGLTRATAGSVLIDGVDLPS